MAAIHEPFVTSMEKLRSVSFVILSLLYFVPSRYAGPLEQHCVEEEATLFPACRRFGEMGAVDDALLDELPGLEGDHAAAGNLLQRISELTGDYDLDRAMCNTHRAAVDALRELQADLHVHIHEENNVLFTRVREAAAA